MVARAGELAKPIPDASSVAPSVSRIDVGLFRDVCPGDPWYLQSFNPMTPAGGARYCSGALGEVTASRSSPRPPWKFVIRSPDGFANYDPRSAGHPPRRSELLLRPRARARQRQLLTAAGGACLPGRAQRGWEDDSAAAS